MDISDWAQNQLYFQDGRFAKDKLWCFFTLNYIYRRRNSNQSQWFIKDFAGNVPPSLNQLQDLIDAGDMTFIEKLMYFGKVVPGTAAYWRSKKAELYSWINHHVEFGRGAPTIFMTLSCAEYFWPDLKRLLQDFIMSSEKKNINLEMNIHGLGEIINSLSLIVQDFFHVRVDTFLQHIGKQLFGIHHYWGRFEFAKSRGQIHLHLLGIINGAVKDGGIQDHLHKYKDNKKEQAKVLSEWARDTFNMTAELKDDNSILSDHDISPCNIRLFQTKDMGTDQLELCKFCQIHTCSDYCLRTSKTKEKSDESNENTTKSNKKRKCRVGCGTEIKPLSAITPGWPIQDSDTIDKDARGFKKLCLKRNNSRLTQSSLYCLQSWRANCDISILIYETDPKYPDATEISNITDYVISYACKGNQSYAIERKQIKDFTQR
jgi:hypothetical protein